MDITKLKDDCYLLGNYLEKARYSKIYQGEIKRAYEFIMENNSDEWQSFADIERSYCTSDKVNTNNARRTALNVIARFYLYGRYPMGFKDYVLKNDSVPNLIPEYKEFYDYVSVQTVNNGLAESYNEAILSALREFLLFIQSKGITSLKNIESAQIISFFFEAGGHNSYDYTLRLRRAFRTGSGWSGECKRIESEIPKIRRRRKNIQYLTPEEIAALKETLDSESTNLTLCDRAIGYLLLYTGLRACDISNLKLKDIDWENDQITIVQSKTGSPLRLPLIPIVGNMIFRYLTEERPDCNLPYIFLTKNHPYRKYSNKSVESLIIKRIMKEAGIRQKKGDRQGSHIFRHAYTKALLENNVSLPVITEMLGHQSPSSVEAYLNTDFVHLKQCALSVDKFPVDWEAINND